MVDNTNFPENWKNLIATATKVITMTEKNGNNLLSKFQRSTLRNLETAISEEANEDMIRSQCLVLTDYLVSGLRPALSSKENQSQCTVLAKELMLAFSSLDK